MVAMSAENSPNWLTNPMNDLSCVMFVGFGNYAIALTLSGSADSPPLSTMYPANWTRWTTRLNFDFPNVMWFSRHVNNMDRASSYAIVTDSASESMPSTTQMSLAKCPKAAPTRRQYLSPVETRPIGPLRNLNLPRGVMNVVKSWLSPAKGICQYPFFAL